MRTAVRSVYLLDGGTLDVEASTVVPGQDFGRLLRVPVQIFLLETTRGYVLVDAGLNPGVIDDPVATWGEDLAASARPRMQARHHLYAQLTLLGLTQADLTSVIYTHLHHDHAGGAALFPNAEHIVQRREWQWAVNPAAFAKGGYVESDYNRSELSWTLADDDRVVMPGVHLVSTPGHSPGHQSVVLWETPDAGTLVIAGDAFNCHANAERDLPPGISTDAEEAVRSMHRLLALTEATGATLIHGHDMSEFHALAKLPDPLHAPRQARSPTRSQQVGRDRCPDPAA